MISHYMALNRLQVQLRSRQRTLRGNALPLHWKHTVRSAGRTSCKPQKGLLLLLLVLRLLLPLLDLQVCACFHIPAAEPVTCQCFVQFDVASPSAGSCPAEHW